MILFSCHGNKLEAHNVLIANDDEELEAPDILVVHDDDELDAYDVLADDNDELEGLEAHTMMSLKHRTSQHS